VNFTSEIPHDGPSGADSGVVMTTHPAVPAISTLVEVTADDEPIRGVRIDEIQGSRLTMSPPAERSLLPDVGDPVTLRWPAGARGRYAVTGSVVGRPGTRVVVELNDRAEIEQHRHFVRGGGGEQVRMHRAGSSDAEDVCGWIRDISERGLRAHFTETTVTDGDPLRLTIHLDDDTIEVAGTVLTVAVRSPGEGGPATTRVEVIALFDPGEVQAQIIRRYVLRQQLLARARTAD
jgi:hypothetical protein